MSGLVDYIRWRGDILLRQVPFGEVDALVLAELVYIDYHLFFGKEEGKTFGDLGKALFGVYDKKKIRELFLQMRASVKILAEAYKSPRYKDLVISKYTEQIEEGRQQQFCAMCVDLDEERQALVYSGTDDSLVGWKENFSMSYEDVTAAQSKAVDFINRYADERKKLLLCGHSKGGNLAVFAAMHCEQHIRDRIEFVYSFDGPGFRKEVLEQELFKAIKDRVRSIVPEDAVVGLLLYHPESMEVVRSERSGLAAHDATFWKVAGSRFVRGEGLSENAKLLDEIIDTWLESLSFSERKDAIAHVFGVFEENNIKYLSDFKHLSLQEISVLIDSAEKLDPKGKEVVKRALSLLYREGSKLITEKVYGSFSKIFQGKKQLRIEGRKVKRGIKA